MCDIETYNTKTNMLSWSYPIITTYTQHAHLLAILGNYKHTYSWIYSNYINIFSNKDLSVNTWADFYFPMPYELRPSDNCKFLITQKFKRDFLKDKFSSIMEFIMYAINSGCYVHLMLDYFHITGSHDFEKVHRIHDALIYGYDLTRDVIKACDFMVTGRYDKITIPISKIDLAFNDYELAWNHDFLNGIVYLYSVNLNCDYEFNIDNIFSSIKLYLNSCMLEYWNVYNRENRKDIVCGKDIYEALRCYVINAKKIDIRPFYLLYDHKKIMMSRFDYLAEMNLTNTEYLKSFCDIKNESQNIVNHIIKYGFDAKKKSLEEIVENLKVIESKEYEILLRIIR